MATPVTPTLSTSSGYLIDIRDQVSNLIRFLIMNPGETSDIWEGQLISFRNLAYAHEHDRDELCSQLSKRVTNILAKKFADYSFDVDFTHEDYIKGVPDGRYRVNFSIIITYGPSGEMNEPALVSGDISVDEHNAIKLNYSKSVDTAELN